MPQMPTYEYQSLRTGANGEIRLLRLLPESARDPEMVAKIETVPVNETNWPRYEAVSYTCVTPDCRTVQTVDEVRGTEDDVFKHNLATLLNHLRLRDRPRLLWIDAICVNPEDPVERSDHVKKAGSIFRRAGRVIVWLGQEEKWSTLALRTMDHLGSQIEIDWRSSTMRPKSTASFPGVAHWSDVNAPLPYDWTTWSAIFYLLQRPWFDRLWIRQEVRLPSSTAVILQCGNETMTWEHFRRAIYCLRAKLNVPDISGTFKQRIKHVRKLCEPFSFVRLDILTNRTLDCKCSDPRDRVFAFLESAYPPGAKVDIEPDYTKTVGEVYQDVAVEHIKKGRSLGILKHCCMRDEDSELAGSIPYWAVPTELLVWNVPSWVPDWSMGRVSFDLPFINACSGALGFSRFDGTGVLEVLGIDLGAVRGSQAIIPPRDTASDMFKLLKRLVPHSLDDRVRYVAGGSWGDAFLRTFCCNFFDDTFSPPSPSLPNFQGVKEAFLKRLASSEEEINTSSSTPSPALASYLHYTRGYAAERCFFQRSRRYIGLGPQKTQVGDHVFVIFGCETPLVLRKSTLVEKAWQVVGSCYVPGVEDGQVFLGGLHQRYRRIIRFEATLGGLVPDFIDQPMQEVLVEDPRLGPLPTGWNVQRNKHKKPRYMYTHDGDDCKNKAGDAPAAQWTYNDPRLTVKALKQRGVDFQLVRLV